MARKRIRIVIGKTLEREPESILKKKIRKRNRTDIGKRLGSEFQ